MRDESPPPPSTHAEWLQRPSTGAFLKAPPPIGPLWGFLLNLRLRPPPGGRPLAAPHTCGTRADTLAAAYAFGRWELPCSFRVQYLEWFCSSPPRARRAWLPSVAVPSALWCRVLPFHSSKLGLFDGGIAFVRGGERIRFCSPLCLPTIYFGQFLYVYANWILESLVVGCESPPYPKGIPRPRACPALSSKGGSHAFSLARRSPAFGFDIPLSVLTSLVLVLFGRKHPTVRKAREPLGAQSPFSFGMTQSHLARFWSTDSAGFLCLLFCMQVQKAPASMRAPLK